MSRFGGLSEERPSVFKTRSKLGTHLSTQCSGDERQSQKSPCSEFSKRNFPCSPLGGLSPAKVEVKVRIREKIVGRGQEAKPSVVTPSLQQWRSPSTFRGAPREDPLKWLKEYDRVANFNKWDDMMCLANVYFFLDEGAEEQLKCRAQRSGESTQSYIQSVLGLCQEVNPLMREDEKSITLMKGVAEDIYQALLTREINDTASFIKWCNYIEDMKQKRVGRPRFERLPNVVPVASLTDETDLVSLIRTIVREEVHRLVNQTQESLDSDPQSLEEIVQDEVERVLAPVSTKPTETRPRPTYAAVTRKYRAPVQKFPPEPRKTDVWRTADNRPVCFHCGRPGHVMRYCREKGCL
ncbi:CCHC-type domain-containing protein [Trichonephila clavipes]|uniref:CCHC-type domain-containing protein n=1 Tax=Trichonephila clavipes TaxID=2585209 RepID=A0A8X6VW70_TRICX|nr:CCHC-type domain-containing protein [Trichonephila clavipes]